MKKAIIFVFVLAVLMFAFTACDNNQGGAGDLGGDSAQNELDALKDAINAENVPCIKTTTSHTVAEAVSASESITMEKTETETEYYDGTNYKSITKTVQNGVTEETYCYYIKTDAGYSMYMLSGGMYMYGEITSAESDELGLLAWEMNDILTDLSNVTVEKNGDEVIYRRSIEDTIDQTITVKDGKIQSQNIKTKGFMTMEPPLVMEITTTKTEITMDQVIEYTDVSEITVPADWDYENQVVFNWAEFKAMISDGLSGIQ